MKFKKTLTFLGAALLLFGCAPTDGIEDPPSVHEVYLMYAEGEDDPLDYESWLESITGEPGYDGESGKDVYVGNNGNWWIDEYDTGVPVSPKGETGEQGDKGPDGENGKDPYIGDNGNWWIDGVDTGIQAAGEDGHSPEVSIGDNGNWWIDGVDTGIRADIEGEHVIRFDPNGGQLPEGQPGEITVKHGYNIDNLPIPTKDGRDFLGWYSDFDDGILFTDLTVVHEDLTLFAAWDQYLVTFNNSGTTLAYDEVAHGGTAVYRGDTPTKEQSGDVVYLFRGWDSPLHSVYSDLELEAMFEETEAGLVELTFISESFDGPKTVTMPVGSPIEAPYVTHLSNVYETRYFVDWFYEDGTSLEERGGVATRSATLRAVFSYGAFSAPDLHDFTFEEVKGGYKAIYHGSKESVRIPSYHDGQKVVDFYLYGNSTIDLFIPPSIAEKRFDELIYDNSSIQTLYTPFVDEWNYGSRFFSLTHLELGEGIESLTSSDPFFGSALTNIKFPSSLHTLGVGVFDSYLERIYIPETLTAIAEGAFYYYMEADVYTPFAEKPEGWHEFAFGERAAIHYGTTYQDMVADYRQEVGQ